MILFKLVPILFIIVGAFYTILPRVGWEMRRYSHGEPSPATLIFIRVIGVFIIIIGFSVLSIFP